MNSVKKINLQTPLKNGVNDHRGEMKEGSLFRERGYSFVRGYVKER
jgi:hypothetical protein